MKYENTYESVLDESRPQRYNPHQTLRKIGGLLMEDKMERSMCVDALETVSLRLGQLNNMIKSLCLGMKQENIEQQAVDCMQCVEYCVNDTKNIVDGIMLQIRKEVKEHE